jgi:ATP-dependent Lhr-like helicase
MPESDDLTGLFEPYVWDWFTSAFDAPSPPQVEAWPAIARGENTLVFSPTGSGKTLAAFLWCINDLFALAGRQELRDAVHVLYVSPLKALNNDIQKNLVEPLAGIRERAASAGLDLPEVRSQVRTGDTPPSERAQMAHHPPHIFITTPESLFIILSTEKMRQAFRAVRYVIVDEIHALSDNKRGVHLSLSLERLERFAGRPFVRIGCSATQKPLERIAGFLAGFDDEGRPRPCTIVDAGARKDLDVQVLAPVDNLLEAHFDAIWGSCYDQLLSMIRAHRTTLVFTSSRYKTERTALRLNELGADETATVGAHHGSMSKGVRLDMEDRLKRGELDALVATSSLELGIDVGSIDLVCQVESPKSVSRGLQRIGRAGHLLRATSKGRLLVTDRDDLVESAVLVRAIMDGHLDTTCIPTNCTDVLAQHVVGAVAARDWQADDLYALCRRSWCYRDLTRDDFDRVLGMLAGYCEFEGEEAPYPRIMWDRVNGVLSAERSSRLIAFTASGTIPDTADYEVYLQERETSVGQLDEGFVEDLRVGDIFVLGSSSWRVIGFDRSRVLVEDVYGRPPTIPFWLGERDSRTRGLGRMVGAFRRELAGRLDDPHVEAWLQREYHVNGKGARSIAEYFREQRAVTGDVPSDELVLVEHFEDELGQAQIVLHSSYGVKVNNTWAMALARAVEQGHGFHPQTATTDDGILLTLAKEQAGALDPADLPGTVSSEELEGLAREAVLESPLFRSRFRHNAVRSLLVLRAYQGRRTPVWLQNLRASALLDACRGDLDFPVVAETLRECMNEALDIEGLREVLERIETGEVRTRVLGTRIPSPFTHSLLLLGQYGALGANAGRERRSRLMHLHRELLRQILDEETLRNLLDQEVVESVDARLQHRAGERRARDANELARVLIELGDLVEAPGEEMSLEDRVAGDAAAMLAELVAQRRAVPVPMPTTELAPVRWIATESFALYRDAFAVALRPDAAERALLEQIRTDGPLPVPVLAPSADDERKLERLVGSYLALRLPGDGEARCVATDGWVPEDMRAGQRSRREARTAVVRNYLRRRGPVTKYEVMERYGFPESFVEAALEALVEEGVVAQGEYVPTKALPQWCWKTNLEEIHRLTLDRLRREMEPATPQEYAAFLLRWQHVHPETRLAGLDGVRQALAQLQGWETYQGAWERDILPSRIADYAPSMLDRLCYGGEVVWRRFGHRRVRRGYIGFCWRQDADWLVPDPAEAEMDLTQWDEDIAGACDALRRHLRAHGACFFDDMVAGTGLDRRVALRALWHLAWTGEATCDSYEAVRHAQVISGLSGCYDLMNRPGKKGVTLDDIVRHLESRRLDPTIGRWAPTERLLPDAVGDEPAERARRWADLMLRRWGVVCRDMWKQEAAPPSWRDVRRALARLELTGQVQRGFFIEDLSGEQYALPEAVEAIRRARRRGEPAMSDEPMIALSACDPANPFGTLFPLTDEAGEELRLSALPTKYLVVCAGRPVLLYQNSVAVLVDLHADAAERAVSALCGLIDEPRRVEPMEELNVRDWNGHPADVSPARHLLAALGFARSTARSKGLVYNRSTRPRPAVVEAARKEIPAEFEHAGKEEAPVTYDADWLVSRAHRSIRAKLGELIEALPGILPDDCVMDFQPRRFVVRYRGVGCIYPHIQRKQVRLHIRHTGWVPGVAVRPDTDLQSDEFLSAVLSRFHEVKQAIDEKLDAAR